MRKEHVIVEYTKENSTWKIVRGTIIILCKCVPFISFLLAVLLLFGLGQKALVLH